jgi:hypothetical protein
MPVFRTCPLTNPTPYPEINTVLDRLLAGVQNVLGTHFIGLYLHGSLASGDYNPQTSDIDFLVVTLDELPTGLLPRLAAMHARLTASGLKPAARLEGPYIPLAAMRRYDPLKNEYPALRVDGTFAVDGHGTDWIIQRHYLRRQGIVISGPPLQEFIDPVPPAEMQRAVLGILQDWWSPPFPNPARFDSPEYRAYAVLTMCRALYTLQFADVVSKPAAATWAQTALGESWAGLIERALAWQPGALFDSHEQTFAFIRFILERSQEFTIS